MQQKTIDVHDHTMIMLKTHGDLNLQGGSDLKVSILTNDLRDAAYTQDDDQVLVNSRSDLDIVAPESAVISVERVGGDASVRQVETITVQRVGGDFIAQSIGTAEIMSVGGDCRILSHRGALTIQRVGGDLTAAEVRGTLHVEGVGGDADVLMLGGDVQMRAGGDVNLSLAEFSNQSVRVDAGGDVLVVLPADSNVTVELRSRGHDIEIEVGEHSSRIEKRQLSMTLGSGEGRIYIDAGGDIRLTDDFSEMLPAEDRRNEFENHWRSIDEAHSQRAQPDGAEFSVIGDEINEKINRHVDHAMRQADARLQQAMKHLEDRTRRLERHGMRREPAAYTAQVPLGKRSGGTPPAQAPKQAVSEDEKMLILKMLQDKKITAQEAEQLLNALEG